MRQYANVPNTIIPIVRRTNKGEDSFSLNIEYSVSDFEILNSVCLRALGIKRVNLAAPASTKQFARHSCCVAMSHEC